MKKIVLLIVLTLFIVVFRSDLPPRVSTLTGSPEFAAGSPRLAKLLGADGAEGYRQVSAARQFSFPQDHGAHPGYRNEWWYITGNLVGENEERFGFELTLFRFSVTPTIESGDSVWRSNQVFIGHFAITDLAANKFRVATRYSRGSMGLAGAQSDPFRVWLEDWDLGETSVTDPSGESSEEWRLRAADKYIAIDLNLRAEHAPILNGKGGLSKKSSAPGNASYYYSIPRMRTIGTLRSGNKSYDVTGLSWLDREWGSGGLSIEQQGWDWFALQLSDGSSVMFYNLRKMDGTRDFYSAGTFIAADGTATALARDDVAIDVLDIWDSPAGGRYPMAWRMTIKSHDLELRITPIMRGQELTTLVRYWEGAVDVKGERRDTSISGRGYVELTGYAAGSTAE